MNKIFCILTAALWAFLISSCEWTSSEKNDNLTEFGQGKGIVTYTGYEPLKDKPIRLHFYISDSDMTDLPVVFIFPGTGRNANDYLNGWLQSQKSAKAIVVALEFPTDYYSTDEYIAGNMFNGNQPVDESHWSFSVIEPLWEYIKSETENKTTKYHIFGHSAGAQFVHRFVTFKQNTHLGTAIAANAGWYTVPDVAISYPYGLKDSGFADTQTLSHLFGSHLIVALGDQDTDPNDSSLRHTEEADTQGLTRYARGNHYYDRSQQIGSDGGYTFNWEQVIVKGVAHDFAGMMAETGALLF